MSYLVKGEGFGSQVKLLISVCAGKIRPRPDEQTSCLPILVREGVGFFSCLGGFLNGYDIRILMYLACIVSVS